MSTIVDMYAYACYYLLKLLNFLIIYFIINTYTQIYVYN